MQRLYVLPVKDQLMLLLADQEACRQLDAGADLKDIQVFARTIDTSLIINIDENVQVDI